MTSTRLVAGSADLLRCRFATSPLWETVQAARAFIDPRSRPYLRPWWEQVRDRRPPEELLGLHVLYGYVPDFLSQPPNGAAPRIEDQLDAVRATPPEQVAAELRRVDLTRSVAPDAVRAMLEDPETAGNTIVIESRADEERELGGDGLILMPSAFVWPMVTAVVDRPWQPTLIYPARGVGALLGGRTTVSAPLARLLGRTRALILTELAEPASTATLAARHGLAPSTVSAHLVALSDAGLTVRRRHGHEVHYRLTPLGRALTEGLMPGE
jgi:DNA-binding transcriptional ArsR family regulator